MGEGGEKETFTWSSVMGYIIVVVGKVTKHTINRRKGEKNEKKEIGNGNNLEGSNIIISFNFPLKNLWTEIDNSCQSKNSSKNNLMKEERRVVN